jgi:hypothetical protein
MGYFDDWFEGEMTLELDEMSDMDIMNDPFDGDTAVDSSFEEDYFDNIDLYRFNTDSHMRMYRDE